MSREIEITLVIRLPVDACLTPEDYLYAVETAVKENRDVDIFRSKVSEICPIFGVKYETVFTSAGKQLECRCPGFRDIPWGEL